MKTQDSRVNFSKKFKRSEKKNTLLTTETKLRLSSFNFQESPSQTKF